RVRGPAHAGDPLRAERHLEQRRRRGAVRRHEPLRERDDPSAVGDAQAAQLRDRLADALGRDGEQDQVGAVEVLLLGAEVGDPEVARELDTLQVAPVDARGGQLLGLLPGPAQERRANSRALEQHGDGRAERAGADDRRPAGVLPRIAHSRPAIGPWRYHWQFSGPTPSPRRWPTSSSRSASTRWSRSWRTGTASAPGARSPA